MTSSAHVLRFDAPRDRFVYFVDAPSENLIKIGITAEIDERLANLCASSPVPLQLLLWIRGNARDEAAIQTLFGAERTHHEWFNGTPELRSFITTLGAMSSDDVTRHLGALPARRLVSEPRSYRSDRGRKRGSYDVRERQRARAQRLWSAVETAWKAAS